MSRLVAFDNFRPEGTEPIYLQIVAYIKRGIVSGEVPDGDELPSRRTLSALLGLNPNTVQKACRLLEEEGILESRAGAKSYVRFTPEQRAALRDELVTAEAEAAAMRLKASGVTLGEAIRLISRFWEEDQQ